MFNKFKTEKKQKNLLIVLMLFLFSLSTVFAVGFQNNNSVRAFTNTDTTSYVTVGELWNGSSFSSTNLNILYKYLTGNASATISNVDTLASNKTTANTIRSKTISAGTQSGTSYSAKSSSQSVVVTLGGMEWIVTYLSKDRSGNTIATLWLSNNEQDIFEGRSQTEGAYYGYYNGGLYSDWSANWGSNNPEYSYPSNMYGTSYISVVTLNNGGSYSSKSGGATLESFTPTSSSVFAKFTMESVAGSLTDYIVTPSEVSWQEDGQHTSSGYDGGFGWGYDTPNQNWSDSHTGNYSSYNGVSYNYAGKTGNGNWKNHYLWLPSITETGTGLDRYDSIYMGIWNLNTNERANYNGNDSTISSGGLVGSTLGTAYTYSWLRSGYMLDASNAGRLNPSGSYGCHLVYYSLAVRPALHLNLTSAALNLASALDDGKGSITATNLEFTGSNLTPSVTVKYDGTTLNSGTDYTLSYSPSTVKNAGTYTVTATGAGKYEGSISTTFRVTQKAITSLSLSPISTTYTGQAQPPTISVSAGSYNLSSSEYTVSYRRGSATTTDFTSAGTITVSVTASGNCSGTLTKDYVINQKNFSSGITVDSISNQTYTGSSIQPTVTVCDGTTVLQLNTDYTVSYPANTTDVGLKTITITGTGNYVGTTNVTYEIVAKNISSTTVTELSNYTYTGSSITPAVTIQDGSKTLILDTDYTVSYPSDTINIGNKTITIIGKGNYIGTTSASYTITAKSIANATVNTIPSQTYTGSALTPSITVLDGTKTLNKGTDYTVTYRQGSTSGTVVSSIVDAGTYYVTITGTGNYTGTVNTVQTFIVNKKSISGVTISEIADVIYTGSAHTPTPTVTDGSLGTLEYGEDYTRSYLNNTNAGQATFTITGTGNYTGTKSVNFTINPKSIANAIVNTIPSQTYTGSALTPSITVKDGTKTLSKGTDYNVTYRQGSASGSVVSSIVNAGTYYVTITGTGNYTGTASTTRTFTVNPKNMSNTTVSSISNQTYTGDPIQPTVTVKDGTKTLTINKDYTVSYPEDSTNAGSKTITITGKGNYANTTTVTFNIVARSIENVTTSGLSAQIYNNGNEIDPEFILIDSSTGTTHFLQNNKDYTYTLEDNIDVGTGKIIVTGKGNYTGSKTFKFSINPKSIEEKSSINIVTTATQDGSGNYVYNGTAPTFNLVVDGITLNSTKDYNTTYYSVTETGNQTIANLSSEVGTYIIYVSGKGNYTGEIDKQFVIVSKSIADIRIDTIIEMKIL